MQPPVPISSTAPSTSRSRFAWQRFFTQTALGRILLAAIAAAAIVTGYFWYTRYRGTGWSQNFNFVLMYRLSRGEDLYRSGDAMLLHGNRKLPEVAITFDDGPHPTSRPLILDTLKRYGVHATFFDVGINMERRPALVQRTLAEGHEMANHTYHHLRLTDLSPAERRREINDPDITFCAITNRHLKLMRPPGLRYNPAVLAEARALGYVTVNYTTAAKDADAMDPAAPEVIAERTLGRVENGTILLLHDYPGTAEALPTILEALRSRGYRCVTVTEMLEHLPEPARSEASKQLAAAP